METLRAPALEGFVLLGSSVIVLMLLCWSFTRPTASNSSRFVYLTLAIRYAGNVLHPWSIPAVFAGQSLTALGTAALVAGGLAVGKWELLTRRFLLIFYLLPAIFVLSGIYNSEYEGLINTGIRYALFAMIMISAYSAMNATGTGQFYRLLAPVFAIPIILQVYSVLTRQGKATELDGSLSFIGGYVHEGAFAMIPLTLLALTATVSPAKGYQRIAVMFVCLGSLYLANYRTALLASVPIFLVHVVRSVTPDATTAARLLVRLLFVALLVAVGALVWGILADRMSDLTDLAQHLTLLWQPPTDFTTDERQLMSGRLLIWSNYVSATLGPDSGAWLIGFGPDAWADKFQKYAHNVFVSYFFEYGVAGVVAFVIATIVLGMRSLRAAPSRRWELFFCHVAYLVLCLGTMPTVVMEGVLFYGLVCGITWYAFDRDRVSASVGPQPNETTLEIAR